VTACLLLAEITLTRVFSGTMGYYFAFMSISVAMLGLGAGSLWITLRGPLEVHPHVRAGIASLGLGATLAASTWLYLRYYPDIGTVDATSQRTEVLVFGALFVPFLLAGVVVSAVFEAHRERFSTLYAIDLLGAGLGCIAAPLLLDHTAAPKAMFVIAGLAALAAPLFFLSGGKGRWATAAVGAMAIASVAGVLGLRGSDLFDLRIIRGRLYENVVLDRWNDFSRIIVAKSTFFTWGLSDTYPRRSDPQYDLMIEGVAGTQIQKVDRDVHQLDYFDSDITSLPHVLRPKGSALVLGVGGGLDILMARHFDKDPIVGVEVNPMVGEIVNEDFAQWSGRPYHLPGIDVHFENARTWVKRDQDRYDVVTVTWVDSGVGTGAGVFALSENYLYTVEAFQEFLARVKDDGILSFMRARWTPEYDAIKGVGIAVEAMRRMGIAEPEKNIMVTSVKSPHFGDRVMCHVMMRRTPFTPAEIAKVDEVRSRLHFFDLYTPGRGGIDGPMVQVVTGKDRKAVFASFDYDMEPNTDDRPFYFFLRAMNGHEGGREVKILEQSMRTIFVLIGAFLLLPLVALVRRREVKLGTELLPPTVYFSLLGLGFMLIEMKLLQQAALVIGNPTLTLSVVLAGLLLSTGAGALASQRLLGNDPRRRGAALFAALLVVLVAAWAGAERIADFLTAWPLPLRISGVLLAIAPLGFLLGCPLPAGMARLGNTRGLVAWSWGMNGMFGVAGSAVAIYIAINYGLRTAFGAGIACYAAAAVVYLLVLAASAAERQPKPLLESSDPQLDSSRP
jgi:predicted membrane-bound spermidine synthase